MIGSANGGGAYLTGPIAFPPEDASPDDIVRWFLDQQMQNNNDELSSDEDHNTKSGNEK